ncbi:MAG: bifunctional precorrin-2 dehydrogenase/sirohydrochlorin ferrochelatase [Dehalococcoidia bacterium]|nr:bifunctional precorrin-2 dehydrogenase/sirohydrochlorin ferrochelatase [Dehalococcoidia bacterium]
MKEREPASPYYPILLNIQGKRCLVVGGGEIALRKVQTLLEHGAIVEVVSPALCPELNQLVKEGAVRPIQRDYKTEDLNNVLLVIAATDDTKVNAKIAADARKKGILVNVVDKPDISDFIVPSYFRRGDIVVAVSTSGKSPALARKIRVELERNLKAEYARLAVIANEVRSEVKQLGITISGDDWQEVLNLNSLIELIKRGKSKEAREIMLTKLKTMGKRKV